MLWLSPYEVLGAPLSLSLHPILRERKKSASALKQEGAKPLPRQAEGLLTEERLLIRCRWMLHWSCKRKNPHHHHVWGLMREDEQSEHICSDELLHDLLRPFQKQWWNHLQFWSSLHSHIIRYLSERWQIPDMDGLRNMKMSYFQ